MSKKIFIDGQEGTTGLQINERLSRRSDVEVISIDPAKRKEPSERKKLINQSDITILCLPDVASREAVSFIDNDNVKVIDASTAYRTDLDWAYGFPELSAGHRDDIRNSKRVSNPGCYATGFIAGVYPLIAGDIISPKYPITSFGISGYSGGGKKLIEQYESDDVSLKEKLSSPRFYALGLNHKHLPEMKIRCSLDFEPLFTPIVASYYKGMNVAVPLLRRELNKKMKPEEIHQCFLEYYKNEYFIEIAPFDMSKSLDNGFLNETGCNDTNKLEIYVLGNDEQILIISRLDNLGKGASGAALQNMNILLGLDEKTGF
ncbi:MAG TPA: N-acetyl-gamma-glutamyl-phosphate reductase [Spirochaetota bacterium]|nr:N-acetyl-gamma-glutamyl-phosphate reductase [Spirochaetota bacterium]